MSSSLPFGPDARVASSAWPSCCGNVSREGGSEMRTRTEL